MYQQKPNEDLRLLARKNGLAAWEVAKALKISTSTYFYWLRQELTAEKKEQIKTAITACGIKGGGLGGKE